MPPLAPWFAPRAPSNPSASPPTATPAPPRPPPPPAPPPRPLVRAQVALESFRLSPNGEAVVYALRRVAGDAYQSHLWTRPYRGGRARQLTRGPARDGSRAISPDGSSAAPLRAPAGGDGAGVRSPVGLDDAVAQAWILPLDGGEAWQLTRLKYGISSVHWSPD